MKRLFFVIALIPVLVGCGLPQQPVSSGGLAQVLPDAVVVTQTNLLNQAIPFNQAMPMQQPVMIQGDVAAKLLQDLEAMPKSKSTGTAICATNLALDYTLAFERNGKTIAHAKLNPAGCRIVTFNGQSRDGMSPAGEQLWKEFTAALDLNNRQVHGFPSAHLYTLLANNPTKIVVTKDGEVKTITDPSILKMLLSKINQAGESTKKGMLHCNAITSDSYRIAVYYKDGSTRVFENHDGACQPLLDVQNHISFLAGQVLSDKNLM
jgi:predicted secreted Zn-dependent protease